MSIHWVKGSLCEPSSKRHTLSLSLSFYLSPGLNLLQFSPCSIFRLNFTFQYFLKFLLYFLSRFLSTCLPIDCSISFYILILSITSSILLQILIFLFLWVPYLSIFLSSSFFLSKTLSKMVYFCKRKKQIFRKLSFRCFLVDQLFSQSGYSKV